MKGGGTVFRKIRYARLAKDMTQEELAKRSGVSRATIIGLESGKITNAKTETLRKIASALGVTVDSLFFDDSVSQSEYFETNIGEEDGNNGRIN